MSAATPTAPDQEVDRYEAVRQYTLLEILAVWAAAAIPMGLLAWVVAPWLADRFGGDEPLTQALLILLTVGLIWQFVLVLILLRRELGSLEWSRVRDALWLRPPRNPKTRRVGGRVWWWALLFVALVAVWGMVPGIPGPSARDFGDLLGSERGAAFFTGAWGWFALIVVSVVFNTVLGEELLFRGLLLPRMRAVFGRWDWVAVHPLSPARAVGHAGHLGGWHLSRGLSDAALPKRMDGDHRALGSKRLRDRRRPYPRPQVAWHCHFPTGRRVAVDSSFTRPYQSFTGSSQGRPRLRDVGLQPVPWWPAPPR